MLQTYEQQGKRKLGAIIVSTVVVAGAVVFLDQSRSKSAASAQTIDQPSATPNPISASTPLDTPGAATPAATPTPTPAPANSSGYKNGTYSASSSYRVPHSTESIRVTLSLNNGTITAVSVQNSESDRESAAYQEEFVAGYKDYVVGQKISTLNLDVIAGASDTTQGFNDAVSQISQQART